MKISNTENIGSNALKVLVYGQSGAGKTTLAGTIEEPTLVISAEAGLLPLRGKKIDVIDLSIDDNDKIIPKDKRAARLTEVYAYLCTEEAKKKYKWIFLDSLTEINQVILDELMVKYPSRSDSLPMYGELSLRMKALIKAFRDLPFYNVVFTALSEIEKDENGARFVTVSLIGKFAAQLPQYFDEVFYLQAITNESGTTRRLITAQSDRIIAKDRSGKLASMEEPHLGNIAKKIRGAAIINQAATEQVLPAKKESK